MRYFRGIVHLSSWNGALENRVSVSCVCVRLHVCWCMCVCVSVRVCKGVCVRFCAVSTCALWCVCMRQSPRLPMVMRCCVCVCVYVFRTVDLGYVGVRALCQLTAYWRLCMCVHVPYDHAQRVCDDVWCALW